MDVGPSFRVRVDDKRRPALPKQLLDAAGVGTGHDLIARVEGPGRIVLEDAATVLGRLQAAVREGMAARRTTGSLTEQLLAERAADTSLRSVLPAATADTAGEAPAGAGAPGDPAGDPPASSER